MINKFVKKWKIKKVSSLLADDIQGLAMVFVAKKMLPFNARTVANEKLMTDRSGVLAELTLKKEVVLARHRELILAGIDLIVDGRKKLRELGGGDLVKALTVDEFQEMMDLEFEKRCERMKQNGEVVVISGVGLTAEEKEMLSVICEGE